MQADLHGAGYWRESQPDALQPDSTRDQDKPRHTCPPFMALIYSTALFVVCSLNWALPDSDLLWPDCLIQQVGEEQCGTMVRCVASGI